jgi:hypothetical protein
MKKKIVISPVFLLSSLLFIIFPVTSLWGRRVKKDVIMDTEMIEKIFSNFLYDQTDNLITLLDEKLGASWRRVDTINEIATLLEALYNWQKNQEIKIKPTVLSRLGKRFFVSFQRLRLTLDGIYDYGGKHWHVNGEKMFRSTVIKFIKTVLSNVSEPNVFTKILNLERRLIGTRIREKAIPGYVKISYAYTEKVTKWEGPEIVWPDADNVSILPGTGCEDTPFVVNRYKKSVKITKRRGSIDSPEYKNVGKVNVAIPVTPDIIRIVKRNEEDVATWIDRLNAIESDNELRLVVRSIKPVVSYFKGQTVELWNTFIKNLSEYLKRYPAQDVLDKGTIIKIISGGI